MPVCRSPALGASTVRQVYTCNLLVEIHFHPLPLRQLYYIISYCTVEAASKTEEYEKRAKTLFNLTKPVVPKNRNLP